MLSCAHGILARQYVAYCDVKDGRQRHNKPPFVPQTVVELVEHRADGERACRESRYRGGSGDAGHEVEMHYVGLVAHLAQPCYQREPLQSRQQEGRGQHGGCQRQLDVEQYDVERQGAYVLPYGGQFFDNDEQRAVGEGAGRDERHLAPVPASYLVVVCRGHVACHERERLLGHELLHEQAGEAEGGEYLASVAQRKPARSPIYYVPADYEIDIPQVGVDEEEVKQLCYRVERVCKGQAEKEDYPARQDDAQHPLAPEAAEPVVLVALVDAEARREEEGGYAYAADDVEHARVAVELHDIVHEHNAEYRQALRP